MFEVAIFMKSWLQGPKNDAFEAPKCSKSDLGSIKFRVWNLIEFQSGQKVGFGKLSNPDAPL